MPANGLVSNCETESDCALSDYDTDRPRHFP
jgi:hypothetical protein